jgi:uncharacterized membrane protein YdjX (TVP38/TMEM64 family)
MIRFFGWLSIIFLFGVMYLWQPDFFQHSYSIIKHGDIAALAEYLCSFGSWSIVITIILFIIMTFTIVFPFMILSGASGIIYGLFWGTIISWSGEVIGAIFMFIFARYFFRQSIIGWITKSRYLK